MAVTLSKMALNTASVTLNVGEDTVTVTYYPSKVNEKVYASINVLADNANNDFLANAHALNTVLIALMASWDVMQEDGTTPLPITLDVLPDVPLAFRFQLLNAISEDIRGNAVATQTTSS